MNELTSQGLTSRLQRARAKLLNSAAQDIAVPFELVCVCGQRIAGIRQTTSQQVTCSACGERRFVLPVNVYPSTQRVPSEVVGGPFRKRLAAATRELLPRRRPVEAAPTRSSSSSAPSAQPLSPSAAAPTGGRGQAAARRTREGTSQHWAAADNPPPRPARTTAATVETPDAEFPARTATVRRAARRAVTPFRLLMAGILLTACLTAWWSWHRNRLENARQTWRDAMDLAEAAVQERRLPELQTALQDAVDAARLLHRSDPEVQLAANLLLETQAVNQLSSVDLASELQGALDARGRWHPQRAQTVETVLRNGWYLFDCQVYSVDDAAARMRLDLPLRIGPFTVHLEVQSSLLQTAAAALPETSLLFAARVAACQPPLDSTGEWIIQLDADSCALLTSDIHCLEAGLDVDAAVQRQLTQQRQLIEATDVLTLRTTDQQRRQDRQLEPQESAR